MSDDIPDKEMASDIGEDANADWHQEQFEFIAKTLKRNVQLALLWGIPAFLWRSVLIATGGEFLFFSCFSTPGFLGFFLTLTLGTGVGSLVVALVALIGFVSARRRWSFHWCLVANTVSFIPANPFLVIGGGQTLESITRLCQPEIRASFRDKGDGFRRISAMFGIIGTLLILCIVAKVVDASVGYGGIRVEVYNEKASVWVDDKEMKPKPLFDWKTLKGDISVGRATRPEGRRGPHTPIYRKTLHMKVRPGKYQLVIKIGKGSFKTKPIEVSRNGSPVIEVKFLDGQLKAVRGSKVLGKMSSSVPKSGVSKKPLSGK